MKNKLNVDEDLDYEIAKRIHFLASEMNIKYFCKNLPLEIQSYIGRFEARFYTLYWALKKVPKGSSFWNNKLDAYEIIYGPKLKGRKNSSISLEEKVRDYFHVESFRETGKSLDKSIKEYMHKLDIKVDDESKNYDRIHKNYYFIKPKLEHFRKSIK